MSVISSVSAKQRLVDQQLSVTPQPPLDRFTASLDLRLGRWFVTMRDNRLSILDVSDGNSQPRRHASDGEFEARKHAKETFVPFGERYILHPGRFVLAATLEWVKLPNDLMGFVAGKSSWARRGLSVEGAPGVHPRFSGCLTLEVANHGVVPIELRSGMEICQLFLLQMAPEKAETEVETSETSEFSPTVHGMRRKPTIGPMKVDEIVERLRSSI